MFLWLDPGRCDLPADVDAAVLYQTGDAPDDLWSLYKRGAMTEEEYWSGRLAGLPDPACASWTTLRDLADQAICLDEELAALARRIAPSTRLAALSNAGAELERRLDIHHLSDLFEVVINSHRVGMAKPDPAIYAYTARRLDLAPQSILFVDDKARNVQAAAEAGFLVHHYRGVPGLRQDLGTRFGLVGGPKS